MRRTGISQDPDFNTVTVRRIRGYGQSGITIVSDTNILSPAILQVSKLLITRSDTKESGFILDIDEDKPTTLLIKRVINDKVQETGTLYDTEFNRPEGVLYISPIFKLPEENENATTFLLNNMSYILCLEAKEDNTEFTLPALSIFGNDDFKQVRISNVSTYTIKIKYENNTLVEMFQERISLVWCKRDGFYSWNWIP